jgi:hypothetical protein
LIQIKLRLSSGALHFRASSIETEATAASSAQ